MDVIVKDFTQPLHLLFILIIKNDIHLQVSETTHQVGRISISTPFDMPYKEMALHCEALLVGKQQKMSTFMGTHPMQGYFSFRIPAPEYNQQKDESSNSSVQQTLSSVLLYFIKF